jgi:nucleotidyltransferase substrate binding protein (TIGR01987 family)
MKSKNEEVRWIQRLNHFRQALEQLTAAVRLSESRELSDLEKQGLIQAFEFSHELAWNVMKDYFDYQGGNLITGSRDATREAFNKGLLKSADVWMEMIKSRNQTSHTYNKKTADEITKQIRTQYHNEFVNFLNQMSELAKK